MYNCTKFYAFTPNECNGSRMGLPEMHNTLESLIKSAVGERRVSWATFYNILSGVFPVDHRMVGIVLKHGYILHIYPTSMKDEKNNLKKSYGCTTESGESGSINPLYGVSCAKQGGKYMPKCYFLSRKCKNKRINTSVHHMRVKFVDKSPPSPK